MGGIDGILEGINVGIVGDIDGTVLGLVVIAVGAVCIQCTEYRFVFNKFM